MTAYYNEHDPKAAAWLRELIKQGVITDGEVDERSIEDVVPADLVRFDRCHFFAGIGVWDHALTEAGWPDSRRVWTGSCPCQPFSAAGKGAGFDDERHLWPSWFHLIDTYRRSIGRIPTIFGEQVASKDGLTWLDTVQTDLEAIGYATATIDFPSAGVGAPHIRQRLYFVADAEHEGWHDWRNDGPKRNDNDNGRSAAAGSNRDVGRLRSDTGENGNTSDLEKPAIIGRRVRSDGNSTGNGGQVQAPGRSNVSRMVNTELRRSEQCDSGQRAIQEPNPGRSTGVALGDTWEQGRQRSSRDGGSSDDQPGRISQDAPGSIRAASGTATGLTNGFWRDARWIYCRDEKWRPIAPEPSLFPLADGTPGRVGLLRGAGNAINAQAAKAFIESYLEL